MSPRVDVYCILGAPRSGRREVLFDLIDGGLAPETRVTVVIAPDEAASPFEEKLRERKQTTVLRASIDDPKLSIPGETEVLFLLANGRKNPVDEIEALQQLLSAIPAFKLNRILTVVHCRLAEAHKETAPWYEACIHFSDCVLLNRRENVSQKWIREFQDHYHKECFPCLFELVKKGHVENPAVILDPEPRRLSLIFDELESVDQMVFDEEDLPEEPMDLVAPPDPFLERLSNGIRAKAIPDILPFLETLTDE